MTVALNSNPIGLRLKEARETALFKQQRELALTALSLARSGRVHSPQRRAAILMAMKHFGALPVNNKYQLKASVDRDLQVLLKKGLIKASRMHSAGSKKQTYVMLADVLPHDRAYREGVEPLSHTR